MKRAKDVRARRKKLRAEFVSMSRHERHLGRQLAKLRWAMDQSLAELQSLCLHGRVYEFHGELVSDGGDVMTDKPMRVCGHCNLLEQGPYKKLTAVPAAQTTYARMGEFRALGVRLG